MAFHMLHFLLILVRVKRNMDIGLAFKPPPPLWTKSIQMFFYEGSEVYISGREYIRSDFLPESKILPTLYLSLATYTMHH